MQDFLKDTPFILSFMGLTMCIQMFFGSKVTERFLLLVLLGMITVNADKFINLLNRGFASNG